MELERDLRFYLAALLAIFLVTVIGATVLLQRMTPAIERILQENEVSLAASEEMLATLVDLGPDPNPVREQRFVAALARARANITEPEEERVLAVIDQAWPPALAGDGAARRQAIAALLDLSAVNRNAMEQADDQAQQLGRAGMWGVVLVGLIAFWVGLTVVQLARRRYVHPLDDLYRTIELARGGDHHRRVNPGEAGANLRDLCHFVNELLDARDRTSGRAGAGRDGDATTVRAVLTRLLDDRTEPTVVVNLDGDIDAANAAALERLAGDGGEPLRDGLLDAARGDPSPMVKSSRPVPGTDRIICVLAS